MSVQIPTGYGSLAFILSAPAGTQPFIFTMGVDLSEVGGDYLGAANQAHAAWQANLQNETSVDITLDRVLLTVGQDGGENPSVSSDLDPSNGDRSGGNEPIALSVIVNKQTALLGRRGRGRMFIPGLLDANDVDLTGIIAPARIAELTAALETFANELTAGVPAGPPPVDMPAVLLHDGALDGMDPTPLTGLVVNPKVGVLRRRLR